MKLPENINKIAIDIIRAFSAEMYELPAIITHDIKDPIYDDDFILVEAEITTEWGNCKQNHTIRLICLDPERPDEFGIDYQTDDGDVGEITAANIMTQLYFDLALKDLSEEYLI